MAVRANGGVFVPFRKLMKLRAAVRKLEVTADELPSDIDSEYTPLDGLQVQILDIAKDVEDIFCDTATQGRNRRIVVVLPAHIAPRRILKAIPDAS
jgi:hypothetical protein